MNCIFLKNPIGTLKFGKNHTRTQETFLVDLDAAIFTCNWCYGYAWDKNEGIQDHFIRGIVLPDHKKKNFFTNESLHDSSREVLVKDLPAEDQKKIYSLYDDKTLDDIWRMIRDDNDRYEPQWLLPESFQSVKHQYMTDCKCPLMLAETVRHSYDSDRYSAPIIIQPNAILCGSFSYGMAGGTKKLNLSTAYGKINLDYKRWFNGCNRFQSLFYKVCKLDNMFCQLTVSNASHS